MVVIMASRYQDIYPTNPLLRSGDVVKPRAADMMSLEYFQAEPDSMPTRVFEDHHVLINLKAQPHRVENWRDGDHRDFTFRQNEIVVTPAGIESGWRWHAKSECIVITIPPKKLERFANQELGILLSDSQLRDLPQFEDADLTRAACLLLDELSDGQPGSEVMFESLARVFLVKPLRRYGQERSESYEFSQRFTADHYKRVLDYVADHYTAAITVEDLAEQAELSASHFSRLFKETIGVSPHQFVVGYRVEQAKRMLGDPTRPLIDIALACGFSDQPHFSRTFRRMTGQSPKAFRGA